MEEILDMLSSPPNIMIQFSKKHDNSAKVELIQIPDISQTIRNYTSLGSEALENDELKEGIENLR